MKKILLLIATLALSLSAYAEGFQTHNLSARQSGMAGVGTGMNLGAESTWFNPAAVVMQNSIFDVSAGFTGVMSKVKFSMEDYIASTDNPMSKPFYVYASVRPIKWVAIGLALNTPHTSSINWGNNWQGANLCQSASLNQYNLQPTLSVRLGEHLSLGAGLMVTWGDFSFSKSLLPLGDVAGQTFGEYGDNLLSSLKVGGKSRPAFGFNVGLYWEPNNIFSFGASYRHNVKMEVTNGSAELNLGDTPTSALFAGSLADTLLGEQLLGASVSTEIVTPGVISAGFSIHPLNIIDVALDVQYNLWSSYDDMNITLNHTLGSLDITNDSLATKSYKNTFTGRLGIQVSPLGWLAARAGIYYDQSPVREGMMSPNMPSMSNLGVTAGLSLRFLRMIHLDLAYGYVAPFGGGRTDFAEYIHNLTNELTEFGGTYSSEAHSFSVGVRVSF